MNDTMKIRGEQIQDKTIGKNLLKNNCIDSELIDNINSNKILYNNQPLNELINKQILFTISSNDWTNNLFTLNNENIKLNSNGQLLLNSNDQNQIKELINSNITINNQFDNGLILHCDNIPNIELNMILILN